ncbi:MAG: glycosyltransferase [Acidimicrobiales bacterium]|nr:glycosyltransferase [Acidimicrobiales bacterium]
MIPASPPVAFLAWTPVGGRSADIAEAMGGVAWCDYDERRRGWRTAERYLRSAVRQAVWLARHRPASVIATNPPIFCGLVAFAYARLARAPFVLDSHPSAFGYKASRQGRVTQPIHRQLVRRSNAVLVTTEKPARTVSAWGGRPLLVHEPPARLEIRTRPPRRRPLFSFINTFASDEPTAEVVEAARLVPEVDVAITGRISRAPRELLDAPPDNVEFVGWLDAAGYEDLLVRSTAVVSLTTEPTSVMRSAYEAVYAGRPLVLTDTEVLRELFPDAVFTRNDPDALAHAVRDVLDRQRELDALAPGARRRQQERWDAQLRALGQALELGH